MAEAKKIPVREEVPAEFTWKTDDLFPTDEAWEAELEAVRADTRGISDYAGHLGDSAATLLKFLTEQDRFSERLSNLGNYAARKADQDTRNSKYQAMMGKFYSFASELNRLEAFEKPELLAISDETMEQFYAEEPKLELYRRYFDVLRAKKAHTLSDKEEAIIAAAGELANIPSDTYEKLSYADLTFPNVTDKDGNSLPLTDSSFVPYQMSEDRELRKVVYETYYKTYDSIKNTAAATLAGDFKARRFYATVRKYDDALDAALANTRVPREVYYNLVKTVNANLDKFHRYIRLRKKLLGVDELHMYDIYPSIVPGGDRVISFEEAKDTVYEALAPMGEDYRAIIKEGFEHRWIDVYENTGKRSGAYSAGALCHPFVLLNHKDNLDSMFTLAHEMGHAVHSYLSNKHQPNVYRNYPIFVAEVASTCNEALLMEHLLAKTTDKKERAVLINHFLEQFKGTLYRQTMFAEFELKLGELDAAGETLTADRISAEYKALNEKYYGEDMVTDDYIAVEWARIPHFYSNYYVYQYATGYSAAIALSRKILKEGAPAVKDYINEFLKGGCSKTPIDLLKGAGVDMSTAQPIQSALDLFDELLDEMEELMK